MPSSRDSETTIKPGQRIADRYRTQRLIGQGGMGIVFLAKHEALGQPVALKVLSDSAAGDEVNVQRFLKEARASARIRGEHVVKVFDVGRLPNKTPYIAMEYLRGEDLAHHLDRRGPLPPVEVCRYLLDAIHAIAQAHAMGIVHRDLKPPNLFLEEHPSQPPVLKVLDFGIAKMDEGAAALGATSTGTIMGTPAYMAPEQMRSSRSVDARADIWALGVIAYELMSGKMPYPGESLGDILVAVIEARCPPLHQVVPRVPVALSDVVGRCLMREPALRFADVLELADALAPFAGAEGAAKVQAIRTAASVAGSGIDPLDELPSTSPISSDVPTVPAPWSVFGTRSSRRRDGPLTIGAAAAFIVILGVVVGRGMRPAATTPSAASATGAADGNAAATSDPARAATAATVVESEAGAASVTTAADAGAPVSSKPSASPPRRHAPERSGPSSAGYTDDPSWGGLRDKR